MRKSVLLLVLVAEACSFDYNQLRGSKTGSGDASAMGAAGDGIGGSAGGLDGFAGASGAAGTLVSGVGGTAGTNADAGTDIPTGAAGQTSTGAAGTTGTAGVAGTSGAAGMAGSTGTAGVSSAAGSTGAAGATTGAAGTGPADAGMTGMAGTAGEYVNTCSPVHWTLSASTAINAMDFPTNVVDNNIASRWSTGGNQTAGQYLQIDFSGTVSLTQVVLDASNDADDYPRGYDVGLSANGPTFTSVATGTPAAGPIVTVDFAAAQGRYLRITQTGTANVWWDVDELRLACTVPGVNLDAGLVDPYDPTYWKATASVTGGGDVAANAVDNNAMTRWSSGEDQIPGETFLVDLGGSVPISAVTLDGGGGNDFPVAYTLELSTNGTAFTQVAMGAGVAGLTTISFTRQSALLPRHADGHRFELVVDLRHHGHAVSRTRRAPEKTETLFSRVRSTRRVQNGYDRDEHAWGLSAADDARFIGYITSIVASVPAEASPPQTRRSPCWC